MQGASAPHVGNRKLFYFVLGLAMLGLPYLLPVPEGLTPTAMLTFNDRAAMGLLDALIRARVDVPGTVSVVGYDDSPFSRLAHIDLTTVSQNTPELTEHAMAAVIERLDGGRTGHREVVVRPQLKVRGTTGPPPERRS